jgi:predicted kinase
MSKRVILLKGLPASGKSTWAKKLIDDHPGKYKRISKDHLRSMLDNNKWSKSNEKFILTVRDTLILLALEQGYHVLVDDTNLHPKHESAIRELVKGKAIVEIKDFTDVPLEVCIERDRHRQDYVGEQVIRKMYRDFLIPKPPVITYDVMLPDAILCDLDGTLALFGKANPYDRDFTQDQINKPIRDILIQYKDAAKIIFLSGRKETFRDQTVQWLHMHGLVYAQLHMRPDDDTRKDYIVKQEIYERCIKGKYNIKFILDDRQQVVDLWRSLGLTVLQVAEGDF